MTGAPSTVRQADVDNPDDVAALVRVRHEWRTTEGGESGSLAEFVPAFAAWWREHRDSHSAWLAYGRDGPEVGEVIGMAWLSLFHRVPGPQRFTRLGGFLQSVYVSPAHRGSGTGAALVDAVVARARERGLAYLMVHPSERSYPLYWRAGFADTSGVLELGLAEPRRV